MSEQSKLGADGLEVVAYRVSMPGEPELGTWLDESAESEPQIQKHEALCLLTDAQRLLSQLREELAQRGRASGLMQLALNAAKDQVRVLEEELAQRDAEIAALQQWKAEAIGVMYPVTEYARALGKCPLGGRLSKWLVDDHKRMSAALESQQAVSVGGERDREADRKRFPDPLFNKWLDESITDNGEYSVWDQVGDTCAAWHGWENRQFYVDQEYAELRARAAQPQQAVAGEHDPMRQLANTYKATAMMLSDEVRRLREALELIADTDPDDGTSWFHDVANAALTQSPKGEEE